MDRSYHVLQGPFSGKRPLQWPAVNRPTVYGSKQSDEPPSNSINVQSVPTGLPFPSPMSSGFTFAAPDVLHAETPPKFPKPLPILRSQALPKPCTVCCRIGCELLSHKHYANEKRETPRDKQTTFAPSQLGPQTPTRTTSRFVHYPVIMDAERQNLLAIWSKDWGRVRRGPERHLFPAHWIDSILPAAVGHALLFQTLLATSGVYWALANNSLEDVSSRHLQIALRMLGQTCSDERTASTDECVLTSVLFTLIYLVQGNSFEAERHFSVLVQNVELRGGPHYLGMSGALAEVLLYADHLQAVYFGREPSQKMSLPALEIGISPRLGFAFRELHSSNGFNSDLLSAADSLCRATDIFEHPLTGRREAPGATHSFGYLSSISEYQLARCHVMVQGSGTWNECICLALLLFNSIVLRNHGAVDAPIRRLEYRFWTAIEATVSQDGFRNIPPCLLLWLLMTGLTPCVLADSEYRMNAVEKMRAANGSAAIRGWDHFRTQVLDQHIWMRASQEQVFRDVWQEVEGFRAVIRSSAMR